MRKPHACELATGQRFCHILTTTLDQLSVHLPTIPPDKACANAASTVAAHESDNYPGERLTSKLLQRLDRPLRKQPAQM